MRAARTLGLAVALAGATPGAAPLPAVVAAAVVTAAAAPAGAQRLPPLAYEKYTLPNGLEVILHEDRSVPLVAVNVWYHVGSADEQPGRTGFAHLFEHVMFMGSRHVPVGAFDRWLEAAGGNNNGSTSQDRTNYYAWMPSNALPLALWLEADRMGQLLPSMDQGKLDVQRDVVRNERREVVDNAPYGRASETLLAALFPPTHPYAWDVIGSMRDLGAASLADVTRFFRTYYAPNNATLAIAGDFDRDSVRTWVERHFGHIPRGPAVPRPQVPPVAVARDTFLVLEDRVQLPRLYNAWHGVKAFHADEAPLAVLAHVLAGDKNGRLYRRLVYELQAAQEVTATNFSGRLDGMFTITVTPRPGRAPAELQRLVNAELARVARDGISERELERALNTFQANLLDQVSSVRSKADQLNYYNYFVGTPGWLQEDAARYQRVTAADVQRAARDYLARARVTLTIVPEGRRELMVRGVTQ